LDLVGLIKHFLFSFVEDATLFFTVFHIYKSYTKNSENNLFYLYFMQMAGIDYLSAAAYDHSVESHLAFLASRVRNSLPHG